MSNSNDIDKSDTIDQMSTDQVKKKYRDLKNEIKEWPKKNPEAQVVAESVRAFSRIGNYVKTNKKRSIIFGVIVAGISTGGIGYLADIQFIMDILRLIFNM